MKIPVSTEHESNFSFVSKQLLTYVSMLLRTKFGIAIFLIQVLFFFTCAECQVVFLYFDSCKIGATLAVGFFGQISKVINVFSVIQSFLQNNEYLQTVARCLQMMLRIDEYRIAFVKVDGISTYVMKN